MASSYSRPVVVGAIAGQTTYVPLNRYAETTQISLSVVSGAPTGTIDGTLDTIHWNTNGLAAVNLQPITADHVTPASAGWENIVADVTAAGFTTENGPVAGIRVVLGGTGVLRVVIQQE